MRHRIQTVEPDSIAAQLGIEPGDQLTEINGEPVIDWIDYEALCSASRMKVVVERDGVATEYTFEKDESEPLGLTFSHQMMGGVRLCANHCVFCFVDQLPPDARDTMRVKDDDWRMSLVMGNYVTLTNVSDAEIARIIRRGASPLYISVHATDPEVRCRLLGNPRAGTLLSQLRRLAEGGIRFHAQAVLCPGLNDGAVLDKTIEELFALYPACMSLALVPVGLTRYRPPQSDVRTYTKEEARRVIAMAEAWQSHCQCAKDTRFVFPADEFYILAEQPVPSDEAYEGYEQIDNGVGLLRLLETEFVDAYGELPNGRPRRSAHERTVVLATGQAAAPFLRELMATHPIAGLKVQVVDIVNRYFGDTVTVAGLISGADLVDALRGVPQGTPILITECMLNFEGDRFLDGMTLAEAIQQTGCPILPVGRTGDDLLAALLAQAT